MQAHSKPPGLSGFTSHFCLYCTYFPFAASLCGDVLACGYNCFPGAHVVPAPEFSCNPVSLAAGLVVRPSLLHRQPTSCCQRGSWQHLGQLTEAFCLPFWKPLCAFCLKMNSGRVSLVKIKMHGALTPAPACLCVLAALCRRLAMIPHSLPGPDCGLLL